LSPPDDDLSGRGLGRRWHAVLGLMAGVLLGGRIASGEVNGVVPVVTAAAVGGMAVGWAGFRYGDRAWEWLVKWLPWIP
jgi:hypothetical protein